MTAAQKILDSAPRAASTVVDAPGSSEKALSNQELLLLLVRDLGASLPALQEAADLSKKNAPVAPQPAPSSSTNYGINQAANLLLEKQETAEEVASFISRMLEEMLASSGNNVETKPLTEAISKKVKEVETASKRLALLVSSGPSPFVVEGGGNKGGEPSAQDIKNAVLALGQVISEMLILLIEDAATHSKIASLNGDALIKKIQADLSTLLQQIQDQQAAQAKADKWGFIGKIISGLVAAIMTFVAVVTMQPELIFMAAVAITFMAVALAGKSITQPLADALKPAFGDTVSNILAAVIVAVIVTIMTMGAGAVSVAPEAAGEAAVGSGASVAVEDGAESGESAAASAAAKGAKIPSRGAQYLKLARFGACNGAAYAGLPQAMISAIVPKSDQDKWWAIALNVILTLVVTLAGGGGNTAGNSVATIESLRAGLKAFVKPVADVARNFSEAAAKALEPFANAIKSVFGLKEFTGSDAASLLMGIAKKFPQLMQFAALAQQEQAYSNLYDIQKERAPFDEQTTLLHALEDVFAAQQHNYQNVDSKQAQNMNDMLSGLGNMFGWMNGVNEALMA